MDEILFVGQLVKRAGRFFSRNKRLIIILSVSLTLSTAAQALGEEADGPSWWTEISDGFSSETKIVSYGEYLNSFDSDQNPDNRFINFFTYGAKGEIRNESRCSFKAWEATLSPRLEADWRQWKSGLKEGDNETDHDIYLKYGDLQWNPVSSLFFSYGRKNIQWGPSYLYAPSNPFFSDNGKQNPHLEIDGKEFARIVWLPSFDWTVSLIYQEGNGRDSDDAPYFSKAVAVKADVMGNANSAGLILFGNQDNHFQAGAYATGVLGDAAVLYGEGALGYGTSALYPTKTDNIFGVDLAPVYEDDRQGFVNLLGGATYTFKIGPTLVMEYLYYGQGYTPEQWRDFAALRSRAKDAFTANNSTTPAAAQVLSRTVDPGLRFLRRNYLMIQIHQNDIRDLLDTSLRWTQNLDDGSRQVSFTADLYATDRLSLFTVGTLNFGADKSEFTSLLSRYAMIGFEYAF